MPADKSVQAEREVCVDGHQRLHVQRHALHDVEHEGLEQELFRVCDETESHRVDQELRELRGVDQPEGSPDQKNKHHAELKRNIDQHEGQPQRWNAVQGVALQSHD